MEGSKKRKSMMLIISAMVVSQLSAGTRIDVPVMKNAISMIASSSTKSFAVLVTMRGGGLACKLFDSQGVNTKTIRINGKGRPLGVLSDDTLVQELPPQYRLLGTKLSGYDVNIHPLYWMAGTDFATFMGGRVFIVKEKGGIASFKCDYYDPFATDRSVAEFYRLESKSSPHLEVYDINSEELSRSVAIHLPNGNPTPGRFSDGTIVAIDKRQIVVKMSDTAFSAGDLQNCWSMRQADLSTSSRGQTSVFCAVDTFSGIVQAFGVITERERMGISGGPNRTSFQIVNGKIGFVAAGDFYIAPIACRLSSSACREITYGTSTGRSTPYPEDK